MISDESLLEFAKEYGTPLYVYDGDLVVERYRDLFKFIPYDRLKIHYALKANYNPGLLTLLRDGRGRTRHRQPRRGGLRAETRFPGASGSSIPPTI